MENWEVMRLAITRDVTDRFAADMRKRGYQCSPDLVRRWKREPTSDESPEATGLASPLDKIEDLIEILILRNRAGAALLVNHINAIYHRLAFPDSEVLTLNTQPEINRAGAQLLQASSHAVDSLTRNGVTRETVYALVQLKENADEILACANQDLLKQEQSAAAVSKVASIGGTR